MRFSRVFELSFLSSSSSPSGQRSCCCSCCCRRPCDSLAFLLLSLALGLFCSWRLDQAEAGRQRRRHRCTTVEAQIRSLQLRSRAQKEVESCSLYGRRGKQRKHTSERGSVLQKGSHAREKEECDGEGGQRLRLMRVRARRCAQRAVWRWLIVSHAPV